MLGPCHDESCTPSSATKSQCIANVALSKMLSDNKSKFKCKQILIINIVFRFTN